MEQTLENGIADNLLHNIFNDLSVGLELFDKDGLMIDVNYSRLRSMGIKDKKDILGYNLFNYTSFSDEIKEQVRKGETVRFMAKYDFDDLCRLFPTNLSGIKFFEITVSFVHNDKSEITNYMVITQDITERVLWQNKYDNLYEEVVRSKKELLESEQRMIHLIRQNELVLNNINSGLAYIANDYIVQWENISLCSKSLSYEAYKKGEPCYLTAHNRTTPCENCVMQRARKSGQVESILFNLDNKHVIDKEAAEEINKIFFEVIIAPDYDVDALEILGQKKNRIILVRKEAKLPKKQFRALLNGVLVQDKDTNIETVADLKTVTDKAPTPEEVEDMLFANKIVKNSKSNAIVLAKDKQLLASGVGQTSRVDALKQAIEKAKSFGFDLNGAVMASDAFFPFPDCVEFADKEGITAVIQPGGSVKDDLSFAYCNEHGMAMVTTGIRHFKH